MSESKRTIPTTDPRWRELVARVFHFGFLEHKLFKLAFGNKGIYECFNNIFIAIVHFFNGFELVKQIFTPPLTQWPTLVR